MSKKNAVALVVPEGVVYTVDKLGNKKYSLAPKLVSTIKTDAGSIGEKFQGYMSVMKGKAELCMNITEAFDFWKKEMMGGAVSAGLPLWIKTYIDPTCPEKYGTNGTPERLKFTTNKVAVGIESMVKIAREQLKKASERAKLIEKGIDPKLIPSENDMPSEAFKKARTALTTAERAVAENQFQTKICDGFVLLATGGFDMDQIGKAISSFFPTMVNKENFALNQKGQKLQTAVGLAIFAAQNKGKKQETKEVPPVELAKFETKITKKGKK